MTVAYPRAGVHLTLGQDRLGRLADALGTRLFDFRLVASSSSGSRRRSAGGDPMEVTK
jgi:hypothetical protein